MSEPPPRVDKLLYSVADAAALLSIGRTSVYRLINSGAIPVVHVRGSVRIRHADLVAYVDGHVEVHEAAPRQRRRRAS